MEIAFINIMNKIMKCCIYYANPAFQKPSASISTSVILPKGAPIFLCENTLCSGWIILGETFGQLKRGHSPSDNPNLQLYPWDTLLDQKWKNKWRVLRFFQKLDNRFDFKDFLLCELIVKYLSIRFINWEICLKEKSRLDSSSLLISF